MQVSRPFRKIVTGISVFLLISCVAVSGYLLAGWSLTDAIYMVVITIFGVGYGEVQPIQTNGLRGLTIAVIVAGYAAVIYTVGGFMQMLIDGELNKALGARRMTKGIGQLTQHTIVCGLGRLGTILARELHAAGKPFVAIDSNLERLQGMEQLGYLVIHGDASDEDVLDQAGIRRASMVAAVLSADATNVFVTVTAREMNPDVNIIARGENPKTEKKLLSCGANKVVLPAAIGAHRVAQLIIRPTAEDLFEQLSNASNMMADLHTLGLEMNEVRIEAQSSIVNSTIGQIELQSARSLLIVGVRKSDGTSILNPAADVKLEVNDLLILLGHRQDVAKLAKSLSAMAPQMTYRGVKSNT